MSKRVECPPFGFDIPLTACITRFRRAWDSRCTSCSLGLVRSLEGQMEERARTETDSAGVVVTAVCQCGCGETFDARPRKGGKPKYKDAEHRRRSWSPGGAAYEANLKARRVEGSAEASTVPEASGAESSPPAAESSPQAAESLTVPEASVAEASPPAAEASTVPEASVAEASPSADLGTQQQLGATGAGMPLLVVALRPGCDAGPRLPEPEELPVGYAVRVYRMVRELIRGEG